MAKKIIKAEVYIDFINYSGDVTESVWIASFCSIDRAKEYTSFCKIQDSELTRVRIEENVKEGKR